MRIVMLYRVCAVVAFATLLVACVEDAPPPANTLTSTGELAVPGPWAPPATTVAIAATQYVPVVDPPAVAPLGFCTSSNPFTCSCSHPACTPALPGTVELDQYLRNKFPYLTSGGLYCCRQNSATTSVPKLSVHAIGRAIDLMVPMEGSDADNGLGDPVANWLVENAEFIGIQRIVWDKEYWNGERGFGHLSSNSSPHTNHIHVELSIAGAAKQTEFFTSGFSMGVCDARCEGTRIINADCTTGDCGFYGVDCIPGDPPACGEPPPPEPPEAAPVPNPSLPMVQTDAGLGRVTFLTPQRLFDTRTPADSADLVRGDGSVTGPLTVGQGNVYRQSPSSLPMDTEAVWLNMAAIPLTEQGFMVAGPAGTPQPETSSVNFMPGSARANAAPVVLGDMDGLAFHTIAEVDAIADLNAAFTATGAGLTTAGPVRVLDTRSTGQPLLADQTTEVEVNAPADATGVVASVAVVAGDAQGFLQAFPCDAPVPITSNINYAENSVTANTVFSQLGNGRLCLRSTQDVEVIVDVTGYLSPSGPLSYQAIEPRRLLDTREEDTPFTGRLGSRQVIELPVQTLAGMPGSVWAAVVNVTVLGATERGFLTVFPCSDSVPATSSLNFAPGNPVGALSVSAVSAEGNLCVFASTRAHLIVDVLGVWVHDQAMSPPDPPEMENPDDDGDEGGPIDPTLPGDDIQTNLDTSDASDAGDAGGDTDESRVSDGCGCRTRASRTPTSPYLPMGLALLGCLWMARRRR